MSQTLKTQLNFHGLQAQLKLLPRKLPGTAAGDDRFSLDVALPSTRSCVFDLHSAVGAANDVRSGFAARSKSGSGLHTSQDGRLQPAGPTLAYPGVRLTTSRKLKEALSLLQEGRTHGSTRAAAASDNSESGVVVDGDVVKVNTPAGAVKGDVKMVTARNTSEALLFSVATNLMVRNEPTFRAAPGGSPGSQVYKQVLRVAVSNTGALVLPNALPIFSRLLNEFNMAGRSFLQESAAQPSGKRRHSIIGSMGHGILKSASDPSNASPVVSPAPSPHPKVKHTTFALPPASEASVGGRSKLQRPQPPSHRPSPVRARHRRGMSTGERVAAVVGEMTPILTEEFRAYTKPLWSAPPRLDVMVSLEMQGLSVLLPFHAFSQPYFASGSTMSSRRRRGHGSTKKTRHAEEEQPGISGAVLSLGHFSMAASSRNLVSSTASLSVSHPLIT